MPLTEKELARFVWEEPEACERRGLYIGHDFYAPGRHYQNLPLDPYGVAQQAHLHFVAAENCYYLQVVSLTVGSITAKLYQQAKCHASAIREQILRELQAAHLQAQVATCCVLIGRQVQLTGDLVFTLNLDTACHAYTCTYGAQGVRFENVGKRWYKTSGEQHPALQQLGLDILAERTQQLALHCEQLAAPTTIAPEELVGHLVITAEGVVARQQAGEGEADE